MDIELDEDSLSPEAQEQLRQLQAVVHAKGMSSLGSEDFQSISEPISLNNLGNESSPEGQAEIDIIEPSKPSDEDPLIVVETGPAEDELEPAPSAGKTENDQSANDEDSELGPNTSDEVAGAHQSMSNPPPLGPMPKASGETENDDKGLSKKSGPDHASPVDLGPMPLTQVQGLATCVGDYLSVKKAEHEREMAESKRNSQNAGVGLTLLSLLAGRGKRTTPFQERIAMSKLSSLGSHLSNVDNKAVAYSASVDTLNDYLTSNPDPVVRSGAERVKNELTRLSSKNNMPYAETLDKVLKNDPVVRDPALKNQIVKLYEQDPRLQELTNRVNQNLHDYMQAVDGANSAVHSLAKSDLMPPDFTRQYEDTFMRQFSELKKKEPVVGNNELAESLEKLDELKKRLEEQMRKIAEFIQGIMARLGMK